MDRIDAEVNFSNRGTCRVNLHFTRRRILIAAIAVVGILAYLAMPRRKTDERFVGYWMVMDATGLRLNSDGTGTIEIGIGSFSDNARWWYDGKSLYVRPQRTGLRANLHQLVAELVGPSPTMRFEILRVQPDIIYVNDDEARTALVRVIP